MYVSQLVLEITRRCNMQCLHCLRGNAQRLDMSREVIDAVFRQISSVGSLTLTGGEPGLAIPVIELITECIRIRNVDLQNFWVVTNGKTPIPRAKKFAAALERLLWLCSENDPEMSGLSVSGDEWHDWVDIPEVYETLSFFKTHRHGPQHEKYVIQEGRARLNGLGGREAQDMAPFDASIQSDGHLYIANDLYIAANGNVTSTCDLSYARIDSECLGNVLTDSLEDIVTQWEALCCSKN